MIISMAEILNEAKKGHYGVAAPNVYSEKNVEAAFQAADELKAPIILDVAGCHGIKSMANIARFYERKYPNVVAALNLDHGGDYEEIILAIRSGFSSIMIDRATLPYEENVREVKEIVKIAHAVGVSVEAELGHVGQGYEYEQTRDEGLTKIDEALEYIKETNVDCLAVAVGTSHGTYKGIPHLEFELLANLDKSIEIPLVLHGGSGTGDENLKKAVETGIQKVNLCTDLNIAGIKAMSKYLAFDFSQMRSDVSKGEFGILNNTDMYAAIVEGTTGWKDMLKHYMRLFGSENQIK